MKFEKLPLAWNNEGVEPPQSLKNSGFTAGDKPPADYMNCFMNKTYEAINELQTEVGEHTHTNLETIDAKTINMIGNDNSSTLRNISGTYSDGSEYTYLNVDTDIAERGVMLKDKYCTKDELENVKEQINRVTSNENGYFMLGDNLMIQWGTTQVSYAGGGLTNVEFNRQFNTLFNLQMTNIYHADLNADAEVRDPNCMVRIYGQPTNSGFVVYNTVVNNAKIYWTAIGLVN